MRGRDWNQLKETARGGECTLHVPDRGRSRERDELVMLRRSMSALAVSKRAAGNLGTGM